MTKLDCNVVNCAYNDDNCCKRTDIHVEGIRAETPSETCCGSFAPKGCGCSNSTQKAEKNTDVLCDACECHFNDHEKCAADHIGIVGGHADSCRETECGSFACSCQ